MKLFIDKIDSVLEKFYSSEKSYSILKNRVKHLEEKIKGLEKENLLLKEKLTEVERTFELLKIKNSHSEGLWSGTVDFVIKVVWIIVVSLILYKLGISPPPI